MLLFAFICVHLRFLVLLTVGGCNRMGDIIPFRKIKPVVLLKGNTLCKRGFHRWEVIKDSQFDVKLGQLVTAYKCTRCGQTKNEAR